MALTAGKLYRQSLLDHWPAYAVGLVAILITNGTEALGPKFVQWALDVIAGRGAVPSLFARATPGQSLEALVGWMGVALCVGLAGRVGWRQLLARRTHMAGRELKVRLWGVLRHLPLRTFHDYPLGDLMNRATGDWQASRVIHGFTLVATLDLIFSTLLSIGCMLSLNVGLTLGCLAVFPLLPRRIMRLARREHDLHVHAQEKLSQLSGTVSQALATIRLQRATNSDALWRQSLSTEARAYAERRFQVVKTGWKIFPLGAVPTLIAYGVMLTLGVRKIASGELSIGQFVAMQSYVLMLQGPLFDMGDCIAEWQRGIASLGRIVEIFNLQPLEGRQTQKVGEPDLAAAGPGIELRHLTYAYPGPAARPVLSDLSLSVRPRENIGIYGPVGAGKSTLLALIAGLLEPPAGTLRLAGGDVLELARGWSARHVTMVPQRAFLFAGTIRGNLELDERFPDPALWEALDLVQLADDVRRLTGGLDARVGEWGVNLSGGQKQRLAVARALLRHREFILLDDCLSAVDAATEAEILRRVRVRLGHATVIWVAHRRSTLALCDRVFRLDAGVLREAAPRAPVPAPAAPAGGVRR